VTGPHPAVAATRLAVRNALAGIEGLVLVACSGGADSLALAAAAGFESGRHRWRAGAVVVDHGLQADSAAVAAQVVATVGELGLAPIELVRVVVEGPGGPEAAARDARRAALGAAADRLGAVAVLLGHTLDDQAETVLMGLARGAGAGSLKAMAEQDGRWRRPFLGLTREQTAAATAAQGLTAWQDPHNHDPAFTRVRVRHEVMPLLVDVLGPGVPSALTRTAGRLRDDDAALSVLADQLCGAAADPAMVDGWAVDVLAGAPAAVRTRAVRRLLLDAGVAGVALTAGHVDAVDSLLIAWRGQGPVTLPSGVVASRSCGRLRLDRVTDGR
jgi:tRNA(Ile)-lysidine synthase